MAIRLNPLVFTGLQFDSSGSPFWGDPVATEASLPLTGVNGEVRAALDTDHIYIYDSTTSKWLDLTLNLSAAFGVTPNPQGISNNAVTLGNVTKYYLQLQPADATNPGAVSVNAQDFQGNKTFLNNVDIDGITSTNTLDALNLGDTLAIGITNASIINIGRSGATINIIGTTNSQQVTNLEVTDKNILINDGGGVGSASDSGLDINEGGALGSPTVTAYIKTSADRASWRMKAPASASDFLITPDNSGFSSQLTSAVLTSSRSYNLPDIGGADFVLTEGNQTINGNKTLSGTTNLSNLTASTPLKLDASKNIITAAISLTSDIAGILPIANGGTNSSTALTNNKVMISSGSAIVEAAAITAARALISDANGIPTHSTVTDTELSYVSGVTSAIQTQLNNKQPLDATLTSLAGYNTNGLLTQTAPDTFAGRTLTAANTSVVITDGDGVAGNPTINLDATLVALAGYNTNGILTQTAADTFVGRTITAGNGISVTDGDGVAGNPTITATNFTVGDIVLTSFSAANNQAEGDDVIGLSFNGGNVRAFKAMVSVSLEASTPAYEVFTMSGIQIDGSWSLGYTSVGDNSGVAFSINNSGQVQYISANATGFVSLTMKFRAEVTTV